MANDRVFYSVMVIKYIEEKSKKSKMDRAFKMGTRELCFEIICRNKGRRGYVALVACALATNHFFCIGLAPIL